MTIFDVLTMIGGIAEQGVIDALAALLAKLGAGNPFLMYTIIVWASVLISAFPMSARVVHKLGLEEDNQNFLLMHSIGVNVSGQIASVIAGGLILALVRGMI